MISGKEEFTTLQRTISKLGWFNCRRYMPWCKIIFVVSWCGKAQQHIFWISESKSSNCSSCCRMQIRSNNGDIKRRQCQTNYERWLKFGLQFSKMGAVSLKENYNMTTTREDYTGSEYSCKWVVSIKIHRKSLKFVVQSSLNTENGKPAQQPIVHTHKVVLSSTTDSRQWKTLKASKTGSII